MLTTMFTTPLNFSRARLKMWNGVWSLVLLTYTPLCYTCVMLLNCPKLPVAGRGVDDTYVSVVYLYYSQV